MADVTDSGMANVNLTHVFAENDTCSGMKF